jgi:hypothetical protein
MRRVKLPTFRYIVLNSCTGEIVYESGNLEGADEFLSDLEYDLLESGVEPEPVLEILRLSTAGRIEEYIYD